MQVCAYAAELPPSQLTAALRPCCNTPATRSAAYHALHALLPGRPDLLLALLTRLNEMLYSYPSNSGQLREQYMLQLVSQSSGEGLESLGSGAPCTRWRGLKNAGAPCSHCMVALCCGQASAIDTFHPGNVR